MILRGIYFEYHFDVIHVNDANFHYVCFKIWDGYIEMSLSMQYESISNVTFLD